MSVVAPFQPLQPDRLSDRLAAMLRERIDSGVWEPGHRLPTEARMTQEYGVSRTVVREAVSRLQSMGLITVRQGSGVFVAMPGQPRSLAFDPAVPASLSAVLQVVEVRRCLEGEVAALAAQRIIPEHAAAIGQSLRSIEQAVALGRDGVEEDLAFHRAVARAAGNPHFERLLDFLEQYQREAIRVTRANEEKNSAFTREVNAEHEAIAGAVARGDAEAARAAAVRHMVNAVGRIERADASVRQALGEALHARANDSIAHARTA